MADGKDDDNQPEGFTPQEEKVRIEPR